MCPLPLGQTTPNVWKVKVWNDQMAVFKWETCTITNNNRRRKKTSSKQVLQKNTCHLLCEKNKQLDEVTNSSWLFKDMLESTVIESDIHVQLQTANHFCIQAKYNYWGYITVDLTLNSLLHHVKAARVIWHWDTSGIIMSLMWAKHISYMVTAQASIQAVPSIAKQSWSMPTSCDSSHNRSCWNSN